MKVEEIRDSVSVYWLGSTGGYTGSWTRNDVLRDGGRQQHKTESLNRHSFLSQTKFDQNLPKSQSITVYGTRRLFQLCAQPHGAAKGKQGNRSASIGRQQLSQCSDQPICTALGAHRRQRLPAFGDHGFLSVSGRLQRRSAGEDPYSRNRIKHHLVR